MPETPSAVHPAVAIPIYKADLSAAERLSVDRSVEMLASHALYLVGPAALSAELRVHCARFGRRLQAKTFEDKYFAGIKGYNALMRSKAFYRAFPQHTHVLIAQTDSLVISDQLNAWCERDYSYVGAPWLVGGSVPEKPFRFLGVGNGGFSLRRLADFLRVLDKPRRIPNFMKSGSGGRNDFLKLLRRIKHERVLAYNFEPFFATSNEDFFWGLLVPAACPDFRVPTPEVAAGFAFDAAPRELFQTNGLQLPFGCHAWERYDLAFWQEHLSFLRPPDRAG